ncbi:ClpXP protease specificity-enhancing factor SspB [Alsobacter sp. KACC 23698]|uniref:ClpXP protease specificity-enhancing factor SspB n=1 Tax=Alsobacter sp. KACC 23698 TaxID=3149229 RepID=A0AAU7JAT6_9HYPH
MPQDLIRYDLLVQDALKGVVRKVLADAAAHGLPGEHHFYISFRTGDPGVRISNRLREKYPEEMTIVLQHQFWDLGLTEHTFEVGLSFSGVPERLLVPFDSLTGFFDPSVQFGLKFELSGAEDADNDEGEEDDAEASPAGAPSTPSAKGPAALPSPKQGAAKSGPARIAPAKTSPGKPAAESGSAVAKGDASEDADKAASGAEVVSLDAFRKKP